jgi:hypothetical protein
MVALKNQGEKSGVRSGRELVRPERFELPTCCSGGNRSIQLSYGRVTTVYMAGGSGFNVEGKMAAGASFNF